MNASVKWLAGALLGIVASLLLVGVLSKTPIRHTIQVAPAVVVFIAVVVGNKRAAHAALAIFAFWLLIMTLIWLWLTGIAAITTGTFSVAEIVLTLFIGASCLAGMVGWWRAPSIPNKLFSVVVFAGSAALQIAAMWLSLRPTFEHR